jgi:hypothetical protein
MVESFENMAAPWLSGICDIQSFASDVTLKVIENFKTATLQEVLAGSPHNVRYFRQLFGLHPRTLTMNLPA